MNASEIGMITINAIGTGKRISEIRKERGVTVREIQEVMGFREPRSVYKWQSGESVPNIENLVKLSILLNTPMEKILVTTAADRAA